MSTYQKSAGQNSAIRRILYGFSIHYSATTGLYFGTSAFMMHQPMR